MSRINKLRQRLFNRPKDFTYEEAKKLLEFYDFIENTKGKTSGSRVVFIRKSDGKVFYMHRPHPQSILKMYIVDNLINFVKELSTDNLEDK